ncbi:Mycocerosic acid synthase [Methylacidimicrobium cyclopophantes]|uniref:Mycocerosic acid synthase n=1 Tax=Methylacidimicrobium cyclopophantes TaxID=1041766 RepID=A0A5E6MDL6_9BACT|nr:zinc-binding alcohol dehydrogenase family protein [Methylacidimicrobium cyclopophantes]VVM07302.1 Mycocerosic acid synthase [Methylacidimicrobium cyclopophantes]
MENPTWMEGWRFERYGGPEVLSRVRMLRPRPGPGEVLVRVRASAIHPSDWKNLAGRFGTRTPRIPGRDFAGTIVAGEGREGEEVWGSGPGFGVERDGAHREYLVIPSRWVGPKPTNLRMEEAAAIGVPYLTAWQALVVSGRIERGETLLVIGSTGAVGQAATQIAHAREARVLGAARREENPSGADAVLLTTIGSWEEEVLAMTGGKGADLVLDAVGGALFPRGLRALRRRGRYIAIASDPPVVCFNLVDFYHREQILTGVDSMSLCGEAIVEILRELRPGFEAGVFRPPPIRLWPFAQAPEAYRAALPGQSRRKQVLVME